jgi:tetratricopeptide (TPR) repeat protein
MHNDECRTPSDGQGDPRVEAEGELAVARLNLDGGDPEHAAVHVAQALHHDPSSTDCYAMIDELAGHARNVEELIGWFRIGEPIYLGGAVALAAVYAANGRSAAAVDMLGRITGVRPDLPWCVAPWFGPQLAGRITGIQAAVAVGHFASGLGDPAPAALAEIQEPWLEFARAVAARPETTAQPLGILSSLARRIGGIEDAIEWCTRAEQMDRVGVAESEMRIGAVMLGFAYRSAGRPREAIEAWARGIDLDPYNIDLYIDMAETCMQQDDHAQAIMWAERAMEYDPMHVKPQAVRLAAIYAQSDYTDGSAIEALQQLAEAHPEHTYPRHLINQARQSRPWIGSIPWPTEATAQMIARIMQGRTPSQAPFDDAPHINIIGLETPSPNAVLRTYFPALTVTASKVAEPDIRKPISTAFGEPLWRYEDIREFPTVPPPSGGAVEVLRAVAGPGSWADPISAFDDSVELGKLSEQDLLGLVAHIPAPDDGSWAERWHAGPAYWARIAQAWACLGILHHQSEETPWHGSRRRTLLMRLLFGNEDWSVDAAAFALYVGALVHEDQRPDTARAIGARYLRATLAFGNRPTELHEPLAHLVLACPGMDPRLADYAHEMLKLKRAQDREDEGEDEHAEGEESAGDRGVDVPGRSLGDAEVLAWADRLLAEVAR